MLLPFAQVFDVIFKSPVATRAFEEHFGGLVVGRRIWQR
jgi:hypothetical protein